MSDPPNSELPPWTTAFFDVLLAGETLVRACEAAGIDTNLAYRFRRQQPAFGIAWDAAKQAGALLKKPSPTAGWQMRFLQALTDGADVTAAAHTAGVSKAMVYLERRKEPFRTAWDAIRPVFNAAMTPINWQDELLRLLRTGSTFKQAERELHIDHRRIRNARQTDPVLNEAIRQAMLERPHRRQPALWQELALEARRKGATIEHVAVQAGVQPASIYRRLRIDTVFRSAWDEIPTPNLARRRTPTDWKARFLVALAQYGNVWQAAQRVPVALPRVYIGRSTDQSFRAAWDHALGLAQVTTSKETLQ